MPLVPIHTLDDPRVAPYRNLKDRELAREGGRFIAEGELIVRRLLASDFPTESLLLAERRVAEIAPRVPPEIPVYVVPGPLIHQVVGYKFHSGVMACGRRGPGPTLEQVVAGRDQLTLVVCPEVASADNLGSLVRIAAGFGADAMVLGERCCDPFWRQSVRVSMGAVFRLPLVRSDDLLRDMRLMRERWGVDLVATVLDGDAEPLSDARRGPKLALLFGNEAQGLAPEHIAACGRRITIPMKRGTDSLNVSVAAGVFLYHFTRGA